MKNFQNCLASVVINALIVILYLKFLLARDGIQGLIEIYLVASAISILVYIYRKKTIKVDAILGGFSLIGMLYAMLYKKSWYLFAEMLMTLAIMYSITYFFFDWKRLDDERTGKRGTN